MEVVTGCVVLAGDIGKKLMFQKVARQGRCTVWVSVPWRRA